MTKDLSFEKYVAAGNDFIVVDNRKGVIKDGVKAAKTLCDRKFGIGADGILLLESSKKADVKMRIFNPDGSQAEMCGNGVRCLAHFAVAHKIAKADHTVETGAGLIGAQVRRSTVNAKLTQPSGLKLNIHLRIGGQAQKVHFINTGVPHAVIVNNELDKVDVESRGQEVRRHAHFAPRGTNVNFIHCSKDGIEVRTYERGVEGETLACGTGVTAAAVLYAVRLGHHRRIARPATHRIVVQVKSGETLFVSLKVQRLGNQSQVTEVTLDGAVRWICRGTFDWPAVSESRKVARTAKVRV